jgi:hypothetical protein
MIELPFLVVSLNCPRNIYTNPALSSAPRAPLPPYHSVRRGEPSPPPASPPLLPAIAPPSGRPSLGPVAGCGAGPGLGSPMASLEQEVVVAMASLEQEAVVAAAVVENVTPQQQGGGCGGAGGGGDTVSAWRNVDIAWLKAKEACESRFISGWVKKKYRVF